MSTQTHTKVKDALDHVRATAQELHGAISDAAGKREAATKANFEAFAQKAKTATESVKSSIGAQNEAVKKHLKDAVTHLEATQKYINESVKSSGEQLDTAIRKAAADARASVQKISEAIAEKRSAMKKPK